MYDNKSIPTNYIINFGHGPCFCVTKELILNHSIDIYQKLLDIFIQIKVIGQNEKDEVKKKHIYM